MILKRLVSLYDIPPLTTIGIDEILQWLDEGLSENPPSADKLRGLTLGILRIMDDDNAFSESPIGREVDRLRQEIHALIRSLQSAEN